MTEESAEPLHSLHNSRSYPREDTMKSSTKDKAVGTFHELKGTAKEIAGKLNDDPGLEEEGTDEKIAGKVQKKIGQIKTVLGK